jgi:exopolysaccharide production protein ExoZ
LLVVLYHLPPDLATVPTFFNVGVDIFFVISGFVMVVSTASTPRKAGDFLWQRFVRIVPMYWIMTVVMAVTLWLVAGRLISPQELLQSLLFIPYRDHVSEFVQPILGVGWTLNLEILFYILFALTMAWGGVRQILAMGVVFAAAVALRVLFDPADDTVLFFYTTPILFEFLAGVAIGRILNRVQRVPVIAGIAAVGVAIASFLVLSLNFDAPRIVAQGLPAAMFVAGSLRLESWFRKLSPRGLLQLGDASYSLYLVHVPVLLIVAPLLGGVGFGMGAALATAACTAVAIAAYQLLERPLLALLRGPTALGLAALAARSTIVR